MPYSIFYEILSMTPMVEDKLLELASIFAVDICVYAIMSNHYHVVFHIDCGKVENWQPSEIVVRWHQLFSGTLFSQRFARGEALSIELIKF